MIAVGYCRFSSENQADGFSIEAQKNAIKEFCKKEGHQIVRFYVYEAKTGTTTEGRTSGENISPATVSVKFLLFENPPVLIVMLNE